MKNFFSSLFSFFSSSWWVKITTAEPDCIYYFGPFDKETEAKQSTPGYVEDLEGEGAQNIQISFQQSAKPEKLTIEAEVPAATSVMMTV